MEEIFGAESALAVEQYKRELNLEPINAPQVPDASQGTNASANTAQTMPVVPEHLELEEVLSKDFKQRLDGIMQRLSPQIGNVISQHELETVFGHFLLRIKNNTNTMVHAYDKLEGLRKQAQDATAQLENMTGQELINAVRKNDQKVMDKISNAIDAQNNLANAIRSMRFNQVNANNMEDSASLEENIRTITNDISGFTKEYRKILDKTESMPFDYEELENCFPRNMLGVLGEKYQNAKQELEYFRQNVKALVSNGDSITQSDIKKASDAFKELLDSIRNIKDGAQQQNASVDTMVIKLQMQLDFLENCEKLNNYSDSAKTIREETQSIQQALMNISELDITGNDWWNTTSGAATNKQKTKELFDDMKTAFEQLTNSLANGVFDNQSINDDIVKKAVASAQKFADRLRQEERSDNYHIKGDYRSDYHLKTLYLIEKLDKIAKYPKILKAISENSFDAINEKLQDDYYDNKYYDTGLEELADECDRRVSAIGSAVESILSVPGADDLKNLAKLPFGIFELTEAVMSFPDKSFKTIQKAVEKAQSAFEGFSRSIDANDNTNALDASFEEATEAMANLADAIRGLKLAAPDKYTDELDEMADNLDRQAVKLMNTYAAKREENMARLNGTVMSHANEIRGQMHGTAEAILHYMDKPAKDLENFIESPDKQWTWNEILPLQADFAKLQDAIEEITNNKTLTFDNGTTVLDAKMLEALKKPLLEPMKELLSKASTKLQDCVSMMKAEGLKKQLPQSIRLVAPPDIHSLSESESEIIKKAFPTLARLQEFHTEYNKLKENISELISKKDILTNEQHKTELQEKVVKLKELNRELENEIVNCSKNKLKEEIEQLYSLNKSLKEQGVNRLDSSHKREGDVYYNKAIDILEELSQADYDDFRLHIHRSIEISPDNLLKFVGTSPITRKYGFQKLEGLVDKIISNTDKPDLYLQGSQIRQALLKSIPLSTIIGSQIFGATADMIDELCDDENLKETNTIGAKNHVIACKYKDANGNTEEKVFKNETNSYLFNLGLALGHEGLTSGQVAKLNYSAMKCAEFFNCGDVFVKTSVGMLHGNFGTFMEKAKGVTPRTFNPHKIVKNKVQTDNYAGRYDYMEENQPQNTSISLEAPEKQHENSVRGTMMRKSNKLHWMDMMMGQTDRHVDNFLINVSKDGTVELKAIDNDMCLLKNKPGLKKFRIEQQRIQEVISQGFASKREEFDKFIDSLIAKQVCEREGDGSLIFDTSKMTPSELHTLNKCTGCHNFSVPEYMDIDIYNTLMSLDIKTENTEKNKEARNKRQELLKLLPNDLDIQAKKDFIQRLNEMVELAKEYAANGVVYSEDNWNDPEKQNAMKDKQLEKEKTLAGDDNALKRLCQRFSSDMYFTHVSYMTEKLIEAGKES